MTATPVIAAFDIGSNTIKMTVGRPDGSGGIAVLSTSSDTVRLGAGIERTGLLADDRIDAAMAALGRMAATARELGATGMVGVATAATRSAANGQAFLDRVRTEIGVDVRVIGGDEEAGLTFRGLAAHLDLSGSIVVADIGGLSTEIIQAMDGEVRFATSLALGSGALTDRFVVSDPPTAAELDACQGAARAVIDQADIPPLPTDSARLVAVGGTGEFLARLLPPAMHLSAEGISIVLEGLMRVPSSDIAATLAIPEARARVLPAGGAIVRALVDAFRPFGLDVTQSGIRTGLLLAAFADAAADVPVSDQSPEEASDGEIR